MAKDVFEYEKTVNTEGQVASADYAFIKVGNSNPIGAAAGDSSAGNALVQNLEITYGQQIEEVLQVGSTQIYWMPGRPQGKITISSLVGPGGFFSEWKGKCGIIKFAEVKLKDDFCGFKGSGSLSFSGAVVESLTASMNTGKLTITQGATIRVANMQAK